MLRIGLVTARSSRVLELPRILQGYSGDLSFQIDPVGSGGEFRTDAIWVAPGDRLELQVAPVLDQSWVRVR